MKILVLLICLGSTQSLAKTLHFLQNGTRFKSVSLSELANKVAAEEIKIFEIHVQQPKTFKAFSLRKLLEYGYGPKWRDSAELGFVCSDGYAPKQNLAAVKKHDAYLAFELKGERFRVKSKKKTIELGPFYLVWNNLKSPSIKGDKSFKWPYQVTSINLTSSAETYAEIRPRPKSNPTTKEGFSLFKKYCIACHSLNNVGGRVGPELNYPVSITRMMRPKYLKMWIKDATKLRYRTKMPPYPGGRGKKQDLEIAAIVEYLNHLANSPALLNSKEK